MQVNMPNSASVLAGIGTRGTALRKALTSGRSQRTLAAAAASASAAWALLWLKYRWNLSRYHFRKRERLEAKARGEPATAEEEWSLNIAEQWNTDELVVTIEASIFGKAGSFALPKEARTNNENT